LFLTIGPPTAAVPVSTRVSGRTASDATAGQFAAGVVLPHPKKNGNALNGFRRNK